MTNSLGMPSLQRRVYDYIKKERKVDRSTLMRRVSYLLSAKELSKALNVLVDAGMVKEYVTEASGTGRRGKKHKTVYSARREWPIEEVDNETIGGEMINEFNEREGRSFFCENKKKEKTWNGINKENFTKSGPYVDIPDLLEMQRTSFEDFLQRDIPPEKRTNKGLQRVFEDVFPVESYSGRTVLHCIEYRFGEPRYSIERCKEEGLTYSLPFYVKLRLIRKGAEKIMQQEVYLGNLPLMLEEGYFIIDGAKTVIVQQSKRSPGIFFEEDASASRERMKRIGDLLANQLRIGLTHLAGMVQQKMSIQDSEIITPHSLVAIGPVENSVNEFLDGLKEIKSKVKDSNSSFSDICIYLREKFIEGNGLRKTIRDKRNIEILKRRYGIGCKPETLEEIGKTYRLSRERIRQLCTRSVRLIYDSLPRPQKEFVDNFLLKFSENNGLIPFEGDEDVLHTEEFVYFNTIIKTLEKCIKFDRKVGAWIRKGSAGFMARIEQILDDHFDEGRDYSNVEITNISKILARKLNVPDRLYKCFSKIIVTYWFKNFHGRSFYGRINLTSIYEQMIKQRFPDGIAILRNLEDFNSAAESEGLETMGTSELRALLARSHYLALWDWGVYIHRANIKIDESILKDVNKWLSLKIREGVQKVSLWGAFSQFQRECQKCGIPNEHALYTCMKMKYIGKYNFLKDPYVYPLDIERAINQNEIIENYLLKHTRGIRVEDIRYEFGLKDFQINGIIADSNKISYWGKREVIHIDNICVDDNDLHQICRWFDKELEKYKHISVIHAYQSNIVLCKKNGINNSKALYTVISNYYDKRCVLPRYPFVLSKDCMIEDDGYFSINDAVNHFFESRNRVVYYGELYDYFVKERGYSESSLRTIKYICDGIVEYTRKSFISLKTLNWTEEKAELLEKVAIEKSNKDHNAGQCFSLMSELIEEDLPIIDENIDIGWQRILLSELLEHSERMRILGSMQGVYVLLPNQDGIESEEDLVCHILRNEFDGAANKDKFIERLRKLEISGSLGKKTGGWDKLVVKNEEVFIRN